MERAVNFFQSPESAGHQSSDANSRSDAPQLGHRDGLSVRVPRQTPPQEAQRHWRHDDSSSGLSCSWEETPGGWLAGLLMGVSFADSLLILA
jgi:hypothetical protein